MFFECISCFVLLVGFEYSLKNVKLERESV